MNIFNKIVSDLLCLEVKLEEKDKTLLLVASIPPSYVLGQRPINFDGY